MRVVIDGLGGHLQGLQIVAAVVDGPARRGPGQIFRPQHVLPAQFQRVDLQAARQPVDEDLQRKIDLRLTVAAIGADRGLVGERDAALDGRIGHLVGAGEDHARELRRAVRRVPGAEVGGVLVGDRDDAAIGLRADTDVVHGLARMGAGAEKLQAVFDPLDRSPERHRVQHRQHVLRIEAELHAEAAAHIGCDDPNAPLIERQALRQLLPDQVRRLGGGMDLQRARACPPMGDDAARLHGERAHPVHTEAPLDDDLGGGHAILRIARAVHVAGQQVRGQRLGMQNRRVVGERAQRVRHMRQRLVVDVDEVQRVLCNRAARRDHAHHRLALVDRLIRRQRVVGQQRGAGHRPQHRQRPARGPHVGTRQDVTDAGHGAGLGHVDRANRCAGERTAAHRHLKLVGEVHVIGEETVAPQQTIVLLAREGCADQALARRAHRDASQSAGSSARSALT